MGDVETRLFRYFVALAEEQHFARAALRLGITPPTLTHQIKKLEGELKTRLVERSGNTHVALTDAGLRFFDRAREVLRQIEEAKAVAQQAARGEIGRLEIGFMPSALCAGLLQTVLPDFQRANPAVDITVHRLVPTAQVAGIIQKVLDAGFTRSPQKYPAGLDGFEVYRQPMLLALPQKHALACRKQVAPEMLENETFVNTGPELEVGFWGHTEFVASAGNFTPHVIKRDHDLITVLTYVSMGCGVAVIPQSLARMNIPGVTFREFAGKRLPKAAIAFVYRREGRSPSAERLVSYMRAHALPAGQ